MKALEVKDWINRPKNKQILLSFSKPKTPTQVIKELGIKKFCLKPYLDRDLIVCLNKKARKGRLHSLTDNAKSLLKISDQKSQNINYKLVGWIKSSPLQRMIILKTLSINLSKMTSEEIRIKSIQNPCLSRISTKAILKEFIEKGLVKTQMGNRKRYYWITDLGISVAGQLQ